MKSHTLTTLIEELTEKLAAAEHERWAHWQRYVHSKGIYQSNGSLVLPAELVARWDRQMSTPYAELDEVEKESDRDQVRKYLPLIIAAFEEVTPDDPFA